MSYYYSQNLSAERLQLCYELAPLRVQQYLEAEIDHILEIIKPNDIVLELGCGYGRVLKKMIPRVKNTIGIDVSYTSPRYARDVFLSIPCPLIIMDSLELGFNSNQFDLVFCIQNGISAFGVNPKNLIKETLRVTKPRGFVIFSSYSERFWSDRLHWFQIQSEHGLIGEIDDGLTTNGVIVCKDGFKATTFSRDEFHLLTVDLGKEVRTHEVDDSSIFCEIIA